MAELKVGEKSIEIKYNNYAFRRIEKTLGISIPKMAEKMMNNELGFNEITILLWAGLLANNKEASIEDADKIIDDVGYEDIIIAITDAINEYNPKDTSKNEKNV